MKSGSGCVMLLGGWDNGWSLSATPPKINTVFLLINCINEYLIVLSTCLAIVFGVLVDFSAKNR